MRKNISHKSINTNKFLKYHNSHYWRVNNMDTDSQWYEELFSAIIVSFYTFVVIQEFKYSCYIAEIVLYTCRFSHMPNPVDNLKTGHVRQTHFSVIRLYSMFYGILLTFTNVFIKIVR